MKFDFDTWKCPLCGYIIMDAEMQMFRFDYGCPRCGLGFGYFIPQPAESLSESFEVGD